MSGRRGSAAFLLLVATVLVAGPGAGLYAASPCHEGSPMDCCAGDDGSGTPDPCGCSLSPMAPKSAVVESASISVLLAVTPAEPLAAPGPEAPAPGPRGVVPRARAAPLFVLFVAFLN